MSEGAKGAGVEAGGSGAGAAGAEQERAEVSGPLAQVLWVPGKVIMGSSGF